MKLHSLSCVFLIDDFFESFFVILFCFFPPDDVLCYPPLFEFVTVFCLYSLLKALVRCRRRCCLGTLEEIKLLNANHVDKQTNKQTRYSI